MGTHLIDGQFQSDKYPTTPRGKVPLSVTDPAAQALLWEYAQRHREIDAEFSADLQAALEIAGYRPGKAKPDRTAQLEEVLRAYEQWESDLIKSPEAWATLVSGQGLPKLTLPLWDRLMQIQALRNAALQSERPPYVTVYGVVMEGGGISRAVKMVMTREDADTLGMENGSLFSPVLPPPSRG